VGEQNRSETVKIKSMDLLSAENRLEVARQALEAYPLQPVEVTFLQHSENLTFKVEANEGTYLLRLHAPVTPAFGNHGANVLAVNSEMLWLEALRRARFPVPTPVKTLKRDYVTRVEGVNATVLKWQSGEILTREMETESTATQIGSLVGRLHQQSMRWDQPKGFTRPRRDAAYFEQAMLSLWPAVEDGRISAQDYKALQTSISWLSGEIRNLSQTRMTSGLLHGDLHRGNFLLHRGKIRLIDFSMSAFGHFAYDLGTCLSNVRSAYHPAFWEAYKRYMTLPRDSERLIEAYFLGSYVVTFSLWISDADSQETLIQRVPLIARDYAADFNREVHFWFE
jgi:Ser/Thr protein kinase RdoA (MazF antagonist)